MDELEDRIMVALGLLLGVPLVIILALFLWGLLACLVFGCDIPDGAGAFQIRIIE